MQGMDNDMFGDIHNVVINTNHPIIANKLLSESKEKQGEMASHLHHLALLQQNMLKGEDLANFVKESLNRMS